MVFWKVSKGFYDVTMAYEKHVIIVVVFDTDESHLGKGRVHI